MLRPSLSLALAVAANLGAQPAITNLVLNPREVVVVPVATDRLSMICFPSAISHLEGAFLSTDAEPPARFQISVKAGNAYFSVRALQTNFTATVNVLWNQKTFVFELVPSVQPLLAITLVEPVARDVNAGRRTPTAHRLLGILDTAKAYELLRAQHPAEVADVAYRRESNRYDFVTYEAVLEEAFHFKTEDVLVFRVVFRNKTSAPLYYQPLSFRIEVGNRTFYAAIADGNGTVPPLDRAVVYFAIASAPDGSRPGLSLQNSYRILFTAPLPTPASAPPTAPVNPLINQLR